MIWPFGRPQLTVCLSRSAACLCVSFSVGSFPETFLGVVYRQVNPHLLPNCQFCGALVSVFVCLSCVVFDCEHVCVCVCVCVCVFCAGVCVCSVLPNRCVPHASLPPSQHNTHPNPSKLSTHTHTTTHTIAHTHLHRKKNHDKHTINTHTHTHTYTRTHTHPRPDGQSVTLQVHAESQCEGDRQGRHMCLWY